MQKYTNKAVNICTIIDHHYASFKIYARYNSWSFAKKKKKTIKRANQERKKKKKKHYSYLLTKHTEFEECFGPLGEFSTGGLANNPLIVMLRGQIQ